MIHAFILAGAAFFHPQPSYDSLGVETVNGKIFVIHKVDEKETLYAISRRYGASVEAILQSNPGMTATLEIGQILKVPYARPVAATSSTPGMHKVEPKETMYSISKLYNVTVDEIKTWNNLSDNAIAIGQELIVKKPKNTTPVSSKSESQPPAKNKMHTVASQETLYSVSRQYGVTVQDIKTWNGLQSDELKVGQEIYVSQPQKSAEVSTPANTNPVVTATPAQKEPEVTQETPAETVEPVTPKADPTTASTQTKTQAPTQTQTIKISESPKNSDEVMESGLAQLIEGTEGNRKYLALHRTAPIGTILKVKNEMNNREVFVRVMGKLPDTAVNNKLIIKLSQSAYDRLGAIDAKFRVEVTYYK